MTLSAALRVSASTTPMPWVPSSSLITSGAPPTMLIKSVCPGRVGEPGHRQPDTPAGQQLQRLRSLSRERVIATDSLSG
jgi:hypothetical protein